MGIGGDVSALYSSMLAEAKDKVKTLENKYADMMKSNSVRRLSAVRLLFNYNV